MTDVRVRLTGAEISSLNVQIGDGPSRNGRRAWYVAALESSGDESDSAIVVLRPCCDDVQPEPGFAVCRSCDPPRHVPTAGVWAHLTEHHATVAEIDRAELSDDHEE